jgi:hypothetical protein
MSQDQQKQFTLQTVSRRTNLDQIRHMYATPQNYAPNNKF